jgi:arsenic resistance protein ArsH
MRSLAIDGLSDRRMLRRRQLQSVTRKDSRRDPIVNNLTDALKNIDPALLDAPLTEDKLKAREITHPPRILMLYGSLRARSYSRLTTEEGARLLTAMGAEVKIFNPSGCPMMRRRRTRKWLSCGSWFSGRKAWSGALRASRGHDRHHEGPDRLDTADVRRGPPVTGKTLAVMQVSGGSQSFNAVNQMRILGRWMRMITIPNQSSVAKAWPSLMRMAA